MKKLFQMALRGKTFSLGMRSATKVEVRAFKRALTSAGIKFSHITHIRGAKLPYNGVMHVNSRVFK